LTPGTQAVVSVLAREFGGLSIDHGFDTNTREILLDFEADGRDFTVRITHEYESGYASGQIKVDLNPLGTTLRASPNGVVRVATTGIHCV